MAQSDVQKVAVGKDFYVWRDTSTTKNQCLITAHGMKICSLTKSMNLGHNDVSLLYYSMHGYATTDIGLGLFSQNRGRVVETHTPDTSPDYYLMKYTNTKTGAKGIHKHNEGSESYASVKYAAWAEDMDIITIRYRIGGLVNGVRLSALLKEMWENNLNYEKIHCAFCRGFHS